MKRLMMLAAVLSLCAMSALADATLLTYTADPAQISLRGGAFSIVAANRGASAVAAPTIVVAFPTGCSAGDIVYPSNLSRIVTSVSDGWTISGQAVFTATPAPNSVLQPGDAVRVTFSRVIPNGVEGVVQINVREVNNGAIGAATVPVVKVPAAGDPPPDPVIVPIAGSTASFRTEMQLVNPSDAEVQGTIVFRPAGTSGAADVVAPWVLGPHAARVYADLDRDIGASGIGTVEVRTAGTAPLVTTRLINDSRRDAASAATLPPFRRPDAFVIGEHGYLTAPPDPSGTRFNVAVRTLEEGATIRATLRSAAGTAMQTATSSYAPNTVVQGPASAFVGTTLSGNDYIDVQIVGGSAFVCGSWIDNTSQSASIQCAAR